jgi:hypothetical protein
MVFSQNYFFSQFSQNYFNKKNSVLCRRQVVPQDHKTGSQKSIKKYHAIIWRDIF